MQFKISLHLVVCTCMLLACITQPTEKRQVFFGNNEKLRFDVSEINFVSDIPLPQGFVRIESSPGSFGASLSSIGIRKDQTVYLYNRRKKRNQSVQFAVLDLNIGRKDLVQCADAVMMMRADHLFGMRHFDQLNFLATSGLWLQFSEWLKGYRWKEQNGKLVKIDAGIINGSEAEKFHSFMEFVYSYCGTYSLQKQLIPSDPLVLKPGDVFIKGGFPGHAVIVIDVATNEKGERIFLLAQSYMPAQDIHILKNPSKAISPWYSTKDIFPLYTPEWTFEKGSLMTWKD